MNIYESIAAIMQEGYVISKDKKSQQQGFRYRGIDDVMNTFQPLLSKYKVFCVPEVMAREREERRTNKGTALIYSVLTIRYTFYAEDGTSVSSVVIGEGMDSGDKASNKAMAIAMKYAMFQVFCIPTEEMPDPDAETPPPSTPNGIYCADCGKRIDDGRKRSGAVWPAADIAAYTRDRFGRELCQHCGAAAQKRMDDYANREDGVE